MFGMDVFGGLVFALAAGESFVVYDWKEKCRDVDINTWKDSGNARSEPERPTFDCWREL
jgi:hypothetical protein